MLSRLYRGDDIDIEVDTTPAGRGSRSPLAWSDCRRILTDSESRRADGDVVFHGHRPMKGGTLRWAMPALLLAVGVRADAGAQSAGTAHPAATVQRVVTGARPADGEFQALLATATEAVTDQRWEDARTAYETVRDGAHSAGDELWAARATAGLGVLALRQSKYGEARVFLLDALAVFERAGAAADEGSANRWLGTAAVSTGDRPEAEARYARALRTFEALGDVRSRADVGIALLMLQEESDGAGVTDRLQALQHDAEAVGDLELLGQILHYWGNWHVKRAEYELARQKIEAAQACYRASGNRGHLAATFTSLGLLYRRHGQPAAALQAQLQALDIFQTLDSPKSVMVELNAVAVAYAATGDYPMARSHFERAIALAERERARGFLQTIRGYFGPVLVEAGDVARGRAMLEQVVDQASGLQGLRYAQLSEAYRLEGRFDDALLAARKGLSACQTEVVRLSCLHAQLAHAAAEMALGRETDAIGDQRAALASLEDMHGTLAASDFLKQGYHHLWEPAYSLAIELHSRRGQWREALEVAELARSRAFLDLLATRDRHEQQGRGSVLGTVMLRGEAGRATLESDAAAPAPTAADLTAIAARLGSTLVLYWIGNDHLYVWVLSPRGVLHGVRVGAPRWRIEGLVRSTLAFGAGLPAAQPGERPREQPRGAALVTRGAMSIVVPRSRNAAWGALYELLIAPIERYLPHAVGARLTIVPAGSLLTVPFAALRDAHGRYLIERYALNAVPAAGILQFTAPRHDGPARAAEVLLVADPANPPNLPGEPLPRLPGALAEARAIARLVPTERTQFLAAADATERRVHDLAPGKTVIHFATHAITRDADPMTSFLALGVEGSGDPADGQLTARKIYDLTLEADLVVLSACRSGAGTMTGDGLASLARAFFYAGTPSLIASLWDVADEPTNRLLPAFYRAWLQGADKARALRRAQLRLIADLRTGRVTVSTSAGTLMIPEDPAFWAGFVLLGEPD